MNPLSKVFDNSSDAVFGINTANRIVFTNSTFEQLLGYSRSQLCGRCCADVLCGTDLHGTPFCGPHCPVPKTSNGQLISDFDLIVRHADGHDVLVNIGASYIQAQAEDKSHQVKVFFSLRQVNPQRMLQRMAITPIEAAHKTESCKLDRLTSREKEILALAAEGNKTRQIADSLTISIQTVRVHFKNIYRKLEVNSRTEAVIFVIQQGLH